MRLTLSLLLVVPGLILLATAWLPLGVMLCGAGFWVHERSGLPDRDGLVTLLTTLGAVGAGAVVVQFVAQHLP